MIYSKGVKGKAYSLQENLKGSTLWDFIDLKQRLELFSKGFGIMERAIACEAISIPNIPDCLPQVIRLTIKYGDAYDQVLDKIETLRQELDIHYNYLQPMLKKVLFTD